MTITMHAPQLIWLLLLTFGLIDSTIHHGQPRTPYNAWHQWIASFLGFLLLWWGGFFG